MSHSPSPLCLACPSPLLAAHTHCQFITITPYQLACVMAYALLLAGLDFLLARSQHESQRTFPCRSTALSYQTNTLNSPLMTCCLQPANFLQHWVLFKNSATQTYGDFLFLCFYLWLVCLYSFLLQRPVLSPPAPFWNHGYAPLQEHPESPAWNSITGERKAEVANLQLGATFWRRSINPGLKK